MRRAVAALVLLAPVGLSSCATPSSQPVEIVREDDALREANVRDWVGAMEAGMTRARLDLARRMVRRMGETPG